MKPRPETRAATFKNLAVAVGLLIVMLLLAVVVGVVGAIVRMPGSLLICLVLLVCAAYPFVLNWSDMKVTLRRRRGLCTSCGYDRRGIDAAAACPECGAGVGAG